MYEELIVQLTEQRMLVRHGHLKSYFQSFPCLKVCITERATLVAHICRDAQPLEHLNPIARYHVDLALWVLSIHIVENLGFRITYVPLCKVRSVQSACQNLL